MALLATHRSNVSDEWLLAEQRLSPDPSCNNTSAFSHGFVSRFVQPSQTVIHWLRIPFAKKEKEPELRTGPEGERIAARFLREKGFKILHQSYRSPLGEIDLIAVEKKRNVSNRSIEKVLVFVEVKTWTHPVPSAGPSDAVDLQKQNRLTRLALEYLKKHRLLETKARFDVIEVILVPLQIRHFENAFEATGKFQWFS